jgi:copper transport protein
MPYIKAQIRWIHRLLAIAGAVFFFLASTPQLVQAHNSYEDSVPGEGAALTVAPATWAVTFAKSVPLASASGEVVTASGVRVALAAPRQGASDKEIVFDLPPDLSGNITTRWRLIGTDGHVISGRVSFSVLAQSSATTLTPEQQPSPIPTETTVTPEPIRVALRLVNYAALVLLGGLLFVEYYLAKGSVTTFAARRIVRASTIALALAPLASFFIFMNDVRNTGESFTSAFSTAISLTPGLMLASRAGIGVLLAGFLHRAQQQGEMTKPFLHRIGALFTISCVALAYGGHSRSQAAPLLGVPADVLHVFGISLWLGGLAALLLVVIPAVNTEQSLEAFTRFGRVAQPAFIVILVTGVIQSLRLHGGITTLFSSTHGVLLLIKIAVVLVMVKFAAKNRQTIATQVRRGSPLTESTKAQLVRSSLFEASTGLVVIGITSVLVAASLS